MNTPALKWLYRPLANLQDNVNKDKTTNFYCLVGDLEALCERASFLAKYLEARKGTIGCGPKSHEASVKFANKQLVKVRRALGFSLPKAGEIRI